MAKSNFEEMINYLARLTRVSYKNRAATLPEVNALVAFYEAALTFSSAYSEAKPTPTARNLLPKLKQNTQLLPQAESWWEKGNQNLLSLVDIMAKCDPEKTITQARLEKFASLMGFQNVSAIEPSFTKAGFSVLKRVGGASNINVEDYFYQDDGQALENALRDLRENASGADQAYKSVSNVFDFIEIYKRLNPTVSGTDYRDINEEASRTYSGAGSPFHKAAQNVCVIAGKILTDEDSLRKYQNYLVLTKGGEDSLLTMLNQIQRFEKDIKEDASFAEAVISFIRERLESVSRDEEFAIAVYNKYTNSAYQRVESTISITCPKCGKVHKFHSLEEAHYCDCGTPLIKTCPKCGKSVAASSVQCWSCGFDFTRMGRYDEYKRKCERAIQAQDLEGAQSYFDLTERANPSGEGLNELRIQVNKLVDDFKEPINQIKSLIADRKMYAARTAIQRLKAQRPGINLQVYENQVALEIGTVERAYSKMQQNKEPDERRVELCLRMLAHVSDFPHALSVVNANRPLAPTRVLLTINQEGMSCVLNWAPPSRDALLYTVVRKVGTSPTSPEDGEVIGNSLSVTSLSDGNLQPGKRYYYAVFSARADFPMSVSLPCPADKPALLFTELDARKVRASAEDDRCQLVWTDVPGTAGVRIDRSDDDGRTWQTLADYVQNSFTDRNGLRAGISYRYKLSTVYLVDGASVYSVGVQKSVRLLSKPTPLSLHAECTPAGICTISWDSHGDGAVWLYAIRGNRCVNSGDVFDVDDLDQFGKKLLQKSVSEGGATYNLGANQNAMIVAFRPYGEKVVAGAPIALCTVPPLNVRARLTARGDSTSIHFQIVDLPSPVERVYYHVSFDDDETVITQNMIENGTPKYVERRVYERSNDVEIQHIPKAIIHLSLIAQYKHDGNAFYSPAAIINLSNRPKEKLTYAIQWGTNGIFGKRKTRSGASITIENTSGHDLPSVKLCGRRNGATLFSYNSNDINTLVVFEMDTMSGKSKVTCPIKEVRLNGLPTGADLQLFVVGVGSEFYEQPMCTDAVNRKVP